MSNRNGSVALMVLLLFTKFFATASSDQEKGDRNTRIHTYIKKG